MNRVTEIDSVLSRLHGNLLQDLNRIADTEGPGQRSARAARDKIATAIEMLHRARNAAVRAH